MQDKPTSNEVEQEQPTLEEQAEQQVAGGDSISVSVADYEALQQELAAAKDKAEQQWDIAVRAKAEVENIRRRAEKDVASAHKFGTEKLLGELLPVLDSLDQGLASVDVNDDSQKAIAEGMALTQKMFVDVLAKFQVQMLNPEGESFDPAMHEAMSMLEQADVKPGTILQVIQRGYTLSGRLLRPARVIVAKASSQKVDEKA